jgi:DNA-binding MarR family transcriptional regulator
MDPVQRARAEASGGDLVTELLTASRALVAVAARSLAGLEGRLTLPQYRLLVVLRRRGPTNLSRLAEELTVNPSTALRMIDRLVAAGLVQRGSHPANRREVMIRLTRSGHAVVRRVTTLRNREFSKIVERIPEHQLPQVIAALAIFNQASGEDPEATPDLPGWQ